MPIPWHSLFSEALHPEDTSHAWWSNEIALSSERFSKRKAERFSFLLVLTRIEVGRGDNRSFIGFQDLEIGCMKCLD